MTFSGEFPRTTADKIDYEKMKRMAEEKKSM